MSIKNLAIVFLLANNLQSLSYDFDLIQYTYEQKYYNKAITDKTPNAVLVIAYNRPQYFKELIKSLEKNPESKTMPFYFFLDGGPKATQQVLINLINQSTIKNKEIFLRQRNYGLPKNIIDARRFMFDWCGFDKVIVMEDDLIVTPQFIKLSLSLHDWAVKNVAYVGTTQMFTHCLLSREEKIRKRAWVREAASEWCIFVCYCMHKTCWEIIRNTMYEFEKFVDMIPWSEEFDEERSNLTSCKESPLIREWLKVKLKQHKQQLLNQNKDIFESSAIDYESMILNGFPFLNQDRIMGIALWLHGLCKIETVVNRVQHIGHQGLTVSQNFDWTSGIHLDIFNDDATLKEFKLVAPNLEFALCGFKKNSLNFDS